MDREELLGIRKLVFDEYAERIRLGEFDTNSKSISTILKAIIEIINHLLEEMKKKK